MTKMDEHATRLCEKAHGLPCGKPSIAGRVDDDWVRLETHEPTCPDGVEAVVWVQRTPAIFSRVTFGSVDLRFGSGNECLLLADRLARMAADGMVGEP